MARFSESPRSYPALPDLLRRSKPAAQDSLFLFDPCETWPQDNERMEQDLRDKLARLEQLSPQQAAESIARLEAVHAQRRGMGLGRIRPRALSPRLSCAAQDGHGPKNPRRRDSAH